VKNGPFRARMDDMADNDSVFSGPQKIGVSYQQSPFFRVIHADGAYGGLAPNGHIHITFYSEGPARPQRSTLEVAAGRIPVETPTESPKGQLFRELEASVVMDVNTGAAFYRWFSSKLDELRRILSISDADWKKMIEGAPTILRVGSTILIVPASLLAKGWTRLFEQLFRVDKWSICRG
jgi:hypothetical protein